jgi:hypothetical protein
MGEAFFVIVITTNRDDPTKVVNQRVINWSNSRNRARFERYQNWALRNGHAVHMTAQKG